MSNKIICRVWKNRGNGQKLITIPKKEEKIKEGDYVWVKKID